MTWKDTIYIVGAGAIGYPLAALLTKAGRSVVAVRSSKGDNSGSTVEITVRNDSHRLHAAVRTISLAKLDSLDGVIVVSAKAYANPSIARELAVRNVKGPIVLMQNGLGVEEPFQAHNLAPLYRCVVYVTSETKAEDDFEFRSITSSPIGPVAGDTEMLTQVVESLTTREFPFHAEDNIEREIWKKAIINSVFNSVCPLLETDNGVFVREEMAARLAAELVEECVRVTARLHLGWTEGELMEQIRLISTRSSGQLISTLQDLRAGRQTEIEYLNLAIARIAASMQPAIPVPKVELLGRMILAKSLLSGAGGAANQK